MRCPSCEREIPASARFCSECGAARSGPTNTPGASDAPTIDTPGSVTRAFLGELAKPGDTVRVRPPEPRAPAPGVPSPGRAGEVGSFASLSSSSLHGAFAPGQMLAGRYRVVSLLGRGGMGEVYRADDLMLGAPVALKFLPEALARDERRLQRLMMEVRTTRQISHPNVCRVYDIGEADGRAFISMEYIDGEDLASLLRRIGSLPSDKALQIARQVCAGLAAAHEQGVLHRDLKPANIMLDGRGVARVMDFGVAGHAAELAAKGDITAGTPAYMAPEQLAGIAVTSQSDVYALGLVLYELFTGKPAWAGRATSIQSLRALHENEEPAPPSSVSPDIDPIVDRVIQRCVRFDPAERPSGALAVSAALPGGDPLAAALAAGETPSPEMIAASGRVGALSRGTAMVWFANVAAGLIGVLMIVKYWTVPMDGVAPLAPTVLESKAREVLTMMGEEGRPADFAGGLVWSNAFSSYLLRQALAEKEPRFRHRFEQEWAPAVRYFYRINPEQMASKNVWQAHVTIDDPPMMLAGSARVELDARGRLLRFERVPEPASNSVDAPPDNPDASPRGLDTAPGAGSAPAPPEVDWTPLLRATGLDLTSLSDAEPDWLPLFPSDARRAWSGLLPTDPPIPVRIEAASESGRPVSFRVIHPWTQPERVERNDSRGAVARFAGILQVSLFLSAIAGASLLSWKHTRSGRADRRGAFALALSTLVLVWVGSAIAPDNASTIFTLQWFSNPIYYALWSAGLVWLCYIAIEPILRKLWPATLVSWARVLTGRLRDPMVGRDLLLGVALGLAFQIVLRGGRVVGSFFGSIDEPAAPGVLDVTRGFGALASYLLRGTALTAISVTMLISMLLVGCRLLMRNSTRATIAVFVVMTLIHLGSFGVQPGGIALAVVASLVVVITLVRLGLLAMTVFLLINNVIFNLPMSTDPSSWAFGYTLIACALTIAISIAGAVIALGGQRILGDDR